MTKIIIGLSVGVALFTGCVPTAQIEAVNTKTNDSLKGEYVNPSAITITGKHSINFGNYKGTCNVYRASTSMGYKYGVSNFRGICILNDGTETIKCKTTNSAIDGTLTSGECGKKFVLMAD